MSEQALRPENFTENQPEQTQQDYELDAYYAWQERCDKARQNEQQRWAKNLGVSASLLVQKQPWEKEQPTDVDRQACLDFIKEGVHEGRFAQPAVRAVFGDQSEAKFLDDFLWYHAGDPVRLGQHMPKNPHHDDGLSHYDYDYDYTVVNGYTDRGDLLNIREARNQDASDRNRYLVIIGHMATQQVMRYRINDVETEMTYSDEDSALSTKLILTTDTFDVIDGKTPFEEANNAAGIMRLNEMVVAQKERHDRQAALILSQQKIEYKPFAEEPQPVAGIDRVVRDRHFLTQLAMVAGVTQSDERRYLMPQSYLHRNAA